MDEELWDIDEATVEQDATPEASDGLLKRANRSDTASNETSQLPLRDWEGEQLVATRCSNVGGIIEWLFVPYIVEESSSSAAEAANETSDERRELPKEPNRAAPDEDGEL
jgi:hypothetical protein